MMKPLTNDNNSNNWLGFSLSPQMNKTEGENPQLLPVSSTSLPHLNYSGIYCGMEGESAAAFYPQVSVMPLRADGSLCLMEAMNRAQPQGGMANSTPKLENFFGGATMGAHQYEAAEERALSLDSMQYYNHHVQQYAEYPAFRSHESELLELSGMKNWVSRNYSADREMEQQQKMLSCVTEPGSGSGSGTIGAAMGYGDLQSLSLSMSPGSQSSCVSQQISPATTEYVAVAAAADKKRGSEKVDQKLINHRKSIDTFGQRTSQYRGVTRHRWTGRYEAHLWDNSCKKEGQTRKGRQVYLGGYDMEEKAARAYDLAALKYWGPSTHINFPLEHYQQEVEEMKNMSRQEYVAHLRRKSSGFSRGASIYRGVTRHHQHGRWQARIGRVAGNKDLYLGTFSTQEEAAEAYDVAAIRFRGVSAVTNFDVSRYDVDKIMTSSTLISGEMARRNKTAEPINGNSVAEAKEINNNSISSNDNNAPALLDWNMALQHHHHHHQFSRPVQKAMTVHDLMAGMETFDGAVGTGPRKLMTHFPEASSSLVTSVSCSREGSPEKVPVHFAVPMASNSWISTAQMRPHVPVFASWTDHQSS